MFCRNCGKEVLDDAMFCDRCGTPLREMGSAGINLDKTRAEEKNAENQVKVEVYQPNPVAEPMYGVRDPYVNYTPEQQKSRLAAGLLQIFLGAFGVGRFYLGYMGIGIAQIIVTFITCGVGVLWPIIDGILILSGNVQKDARGIPLKE